jgi:hypothetical protein
MYYIRRPKYGQQHKNLYGILHNQEYKSKAVVVFLYLHNMTFNLFKLITTN